MVNPKTGGPFCLRTIHKDIIAVREAWRERSVRDYGEVVAELSQMLDDLQQIAFVEKNRKLAVQVWDRRAKLHQIERAAQTVLNIGPDDLETLSDEQLERLARGENPFNVLATGDGDSARATGEGGAGAPQEESGGDVE
jgi:hypothetical protein